MSFLTCFWLFPQKEHFSRSESPNFAICLSSLSDGWPTAVRYSGTSPVAVAQGIITRVRRQRKQARPDPAGGDDLVDHAVLLGLLGREDEVAVGVLGDLLDRLARVLGDQALEELARAG